MGLEGQPTLFPRPDERRLAAIRAVLALSDDELERAWPALQELLSEPSPSPRPGRRKTDPASH
jgi:hypothetical protein